MSTQTKEGKTADQKKKCIYYLADLADVPNTDSVDSKLLDQLSRRA